jgi:hypothetical protein
MPHITRNRWPSDFANTTILVDLFPAGRDRPFCRRTCVKSMKGFVNLECI